MEPACPQAVLVSTDPAWGHAGSEVEDQIVEWPKAVRDRAWWRATQGATKLQTPGKLGPNAALTKTLLLRYHIAVWRVLAL